MEFIDFLERSLHLMGNNPPFGYRYTGQYRTPQAIWL